MSPEITFIFTVGAIILGAGVVVSAVVGVIYNLFSQKEFFLMLLVPTVATIAYVLMRSNLGILHGFDGSVNVIRYADWLITTPILLYTLSYVMTSSSSERWKIFIPLASADIVMLLTGLGSEFFAGSLKILFFTISMVAYIYILYVIVNLFVQLDRNNKSQKQISSALWMAGIILVLWSLYPFVWVFGTKGVATFGLQTESIAYMILDVLTKLGFTVFLARYLHSSFSKAVGDNAENG